MLEIDTKPTELHDDTFDDLGMDILEASEIPNSLGFEDFLVGSPRLYAMDEGACGEPESFHRANQTGLPRENPSTLSKVGEIKLPASVIYNMALPPLPLFSDSRPQVTPNTDQNEVSLPPFRTLFKGYLPASPQDDMSRDCEFKSPAAPSEDEMDKLAPVYTDVEDLALDPEELPDNDSGLTASLLNMPSDHQTPVKSRQEDVKMKNAPAISPGKYNFHGEGESSAFADADGGDTKSQRGITKGSKVVRGPIKIPLVTVTGHPEPKLTAALRTAQANAGTSNYVPRWRSNPGKHLTDHGVKKRKRPARKQRYLKDKKAELQRLEVAEEESEAEWEKECNEPGLTNSPREDLPKEVVSQQLDEGWVLGSLMNIPIGNTPEAKARKSAVPKRLATARNTACANAGRSGYVPRSREKRMTPIQGPVTVVFKSKRGPKYASPCSSSRTDIS